MDMLRYHKFGGGPYVMSEFGSPEDLGSKDGGKEEADESADDGEDDEELDQGKTKTAIKAVTSHERCPLGRSRAHGM
jgi:hypothetical protein